MHGKSDSHVKMAGVPSGFVAEDANDNSSMVVE